MLQYDFLFFVVIAVSIFVLARYFFAKKELASASILIDDEYLKEQWKKSSAETGYGEFRDAWIKLSASIGCKKGYILPNVGIDEMKKYSSFPEVVYDVLEGLVGDLPQENDSNMIDTLFIVEALIKKGNVKSKSL